MDAEVSRQRQQGEWSITEPEAAAWNHFVDTHAHGGLLQQTGWGQLKSAFGWRAHRLAVGDQGGQLLAGALLLLRPYYGLSVAYTPRGPLFALDPTINQLLLDGLTRIARRARAVMLRIEPSLTEGHPDADRLHTWLLLQGLRPVATIQPRSTIHVRLDAPEEQILAHCSKGHRADIKRAERGGVKVRIGTSADLPTFQQIMEATGARANFRIHDAAYYQRAWQIFQPRSRLLLAELDGQVVAAHLVFADAQTGLYLYSGALEAGLRSGANHLLAWEALTWARQLGCTTYDLWGIPDALGRAATAPDEPARVALHEAAAADPLIGVYRFKKGFGGQVVRYLPAYDRLLLPLLYPLALKRL
jgi:lipid II:glycine glycyltransferase (peptidoglycan interpeptide bridge formation enzyme)